MDKLIRTSSKESGFSPKNLDRQKFMHIKVLMARTIDSLSEETRKNAGRPNMIYPSFAPLGSRVMGPNGEDH